LVLSVTKVDVAYQIEIGTTFQPSPNPDLGCSSFTSTDLSDVYTSASCVGYEYQLADVLGYEGLTAELLINRYFVKHTYLNIVFYMGLLIFSI